MATTHAMETLERNLRTSLLELPALHDFNCTESVKNEFVNLMFRSLAGNNPQYLKILFPNGLSTNPEIRSSLRVAQGAVEGAEYTEAARGHACGHLMKPFEPSYHCRTCAVDNTCVLCARCFEASDHSGHSYTISLNNSGAGCCDCGDPEAWRNPPPCAIHSPHEGRAPLSGKERANLLPADFIQSIKLTISVLLDYFTDIWSCAPEQLRLVKTVDGVHEDERMATLARGVYWGPDPSSNENDKTQYALCIWNDEKHTIQDVTDTVMRAIRTTKPIGAEIANEVDRVGRAAIKTSDSIPDLLRAAKIIEDPRLSVTIRSCRDIFREEMAATIIEWLLDINGCKVGPDATILKTTICEEFLAKWAVGITGPREIGKDGIYDHDREEIAREFMRTSYGNAFDVLRRLQQAWGPTGDEATSPISEDSFDDQIVPEDELEPREATMAGYPPPPPPPTFNSGLSTAVADSVDGSDAILPVPRTPHQRHSNKIIPRPPKYWLDKPEGYARREGIPAAENLWRRTRLDYLLLYDLRMWKTLRVNLRELLVSTVITLPKYKRLVAFRFASIYTVLAELHLIADREPDHSLLYLTVQLMTTPSITAEIVDTANFLTNLLAIIYTFLTTRQVGYPSEVNLTASFAIDQGVSFNRRSTCFYQDLRHLIATEVVRDIIQAEPRYLLQFLDLVKIHQGLCPNVRAAEQHVEYEMETWMNLLSVMTEMFKFCRSFSESFRLKGAEDVDALMNAIKNTAATVIFNSLGMERRRFDQAEFKRSTRFKPVDPFEFEKSTRINPYIIINFSVDTEPISCYHPLHYILSWLIAEAKSLTPDVVRNNIILSSVQVKALVQAKHGRSTQEFGPNENALAIFDIPIRVLAWLAQARAGMWVRNGQSLRQQLQHYKNVVRRDLTHARDILLLQTAFVLCEPSLILCSLLDRFSLLGMAKGDYDQQDSRDLSQTYDMAEDLVHLLIIVLCDRNRLIPCDDEDERNAKQEIIHALCVKPLAYHELRRQISEPTRELVEKGIMDQLSTFKPPEGVSDQGKFTLKEECLADIDPFSPLMSRNYREDAEMLWRKHMSKKMGLPLEEVVFYPTLEPIPEGILFSGLADFTSTPLFAQTVFYFAQSALIVQQDITGSKLEQFYQFLLHLILIAAMLDTNTEDSMVEDDRTSFCEIALTHQAEKPLSENTIAGLLRRSMELDHLKSCSPRVKMILKIFEEKRPTSYKEFQASLRIPVESTDDSGDSTHTGESERDRKRRQALERQTRVMEQMRQQQNQFIANQQIDWGVDAGSEDEDMVDVDQAKLASYPEGDCLVCKGEKDSPHYGTFAYVTTSQIFRNTPVGQSDWIGEILQLPEDTDRPLRSRPFGVAAQNRKIVQKKMHDGRIVEVVKQDLGKGFPTDWKSRAPVSTGCGHIMHYGCWKTYVETVHRRHSANITRHHPENLDRGEFQCPLCKALCNVFMPIVWKPKVMAYPGPLKDSASVDGWLKAAGTYGQGLALESFYADKSVEQSFGRFGGSSLASPWDDLFLERLNTISDSRKQDLFDLHEMDLPSRTAVQQTNTDHHVGLPPGLNAAFIEPQGNTLFVDTLAAQTLQNMANQPTIPPIPQPPFAQADGPTNPAVAIQLLNEASLNQVQNRTSTPDFSQLEQVYGRLLDAVMDKGQDQYKWELSSILDWKGFPPRELFTLLGHSITSVEIAQRCPETKSASSTTSSSPTKTILDSISPITMMHLRVLSETIQSIITVLASSLDGQQKLALHQARYLPLQHTYLTGNKLPQNDAGFPPISRNLDIGSTYDDYNFKQLNRNLLTDSFVLFTEMTFCNDSEESTNSSPLHSWDVQSAMKYFFLVEIVRVVAFFYCLNGNAKQLIRSYETSPDINVPQYFAKFVEMLVVNDDQNKSKGHVEDLQRLRQLNYAPLYLAVRKYSLPFIRKCLVFMHVRYNVDFEASPLIEAEEWQDMPELERLSALLMLPRLEDLFQEVLVSNPIFMDLARKFWVTGPKECDRKRGIYGDYILETLEEKAFRRFAAASAGDGSSDDRVGQSLLKLESPSDDESLTFTEDDIFLKFSQPETQYFLSHPGVYELVGLPYEFVTLQERVNKATCPTTGNKITEPVICLDCGAIFCGQTVCCQKKKNGQTVGGTWQHREKCSGPSGIYLYIRKCFLLYLHRDSGAFAYMPYLDKYGEGDPQFRSNFLLELVQFRYDQLCRAPWLQHAIPSTVARKLDNDNNQGGWEAL